jgi:hypothetical protein
MRNNKGFIEFTVVITKITFFFDLENSEIRCNIKVLENLEDFTKFFEVYKEGQMIH